MDTITPKELAARIGAGDDDFTWLDVREPWEVEKAAIKHPQITYIPMADIPQKFGELAPERTTVVMCKLGGRSAKVAQFLEQNGFTRIINLDGGIDRWAQDVDADIPVY